MRIQRTVFFALLCPLLLAGCGEAAQDSPAPASSTSPDAGEQIAKDILKEAGVEPADPALACEILDDDLVRAHFDVGDAEITRNPSKYSPHPLCTVSWPKPNAAELEAKSREAMSDYLQRKMKGEDVKMPSFRTTNEVSLTIVKDAFASPEDTITAFDGAMRMMSEGITRTVGEQEVSFQADVEPVDGVGRKAMWSPKLSQVSVATSNRIFHVTVNTDGDQESSKEKAIRIARDVAAAL